MEEKEVLWQNFPDRLVSNLTLHPDREFSNVRKVWPPSWAPAAKPRSPQASRRIRKKADDGGRRRKEKDDAGRRRKKKGGEGRRRKEKKEAAAGTGRRKMEEG